MEKKSNVNVMVELQSVEVKRKGARGAVKSQVGGLVL